MTDTKAVGPAGAVGQAVQEAPGSDPEGGMATAEYAIATLGAVGFAGLLTALLKGGAVKGMLMSLITSALGG
ncbi:hypothetical protein GCM10028784_37250 [Myceligenerans cantabricum]